MIKIFTAQFKQIKRVHAGAALDPVVPDFFERKCSALKTFKAFFKMIDMSEFKMVYRFHVGRTLGRYFFLITAECSIARK